MPVIIDGTLGVNAAAVTTTNWNPTNLTIPGNSTIGDATSDTLTVNATSNFVGKLGVNLTAGTSPTQLLTIKGRFNSDNQNNYYGAWGEGDTAGYSYFAVGEWYNVSAYFQKKIGQSYSHIYTYNSGHNLILQGGSGVNGETAASGNVGIGTTVANTKLEIRSGAPTIRLQETTTGGDKRLEMGVTSAGKAWIGANQSAQSLTFQTVNADRVTIDEAGNVGIGSTSATDVLVVNNSNAYALGLYRNLDYNSVGAMASVITFGGYVGSTRTAVASIAGVLNNSTTGYLSFNTLNAGTQAERVRINYNGNVGIGTFSNLNTTLTVAGTITCGTTNSTGGSTLIQNIYSQSSNDYVTLIGEEYSTGAVSINYAVRNSTTDTGFTSSADNVAWARASLKVGGSTNALRLYGTASALVTKGTAVTLTELMRVTNDGKVGIGTTSPLKQFDQLNNANSTGYVDMFSVRVGNNTDASNYSRLWMGQVTANNMFIEAANQANAKGALHLQPYGGKVGVNTQAIVPTQALDVGGTIFHRADGSYTTYGTVNFTKGVHSGTSAGVIATLTSTGTQTMAVAVVEWVGIYAWAGTDLGQATIVSSVRRSNNDTSWTTISNAAPVYNQVGTSATKPSVYWSNGSLMYDYGGSNEGVITVRITYRDCNITTYPST